MTADGGTTITDYGIVWATTANPTTGNNKVQKGTTETLGAFTVSATGLNAGTLIYYRGYAVNAVGTNYDSTGDSFYTLSTVPSTHVGSFSASAASASGINLTWTAATGASGYLILQASGSTAPVGPPANATGYSVGNTINDGTVAAIVTSGSATSSTISGLVPGSAYSFAIFPYAWDGSDAATYDYRTVATVPTATATTLTAPAITVSSGSLSFSPTVPNATSGNQTYTVSGANLTGNITITAPANFQVSTSSGSGFGSSITLTQSGGTVGNTTIYVQFSPTAMTTYSGNITHSSSGANSPNVAVSGTGANAPSITTQPASLPMTNGVTLNGTVTANNGAALTDRGFYWSASPGVTTSSTKADEGGTTVAAYSAAISGLSVNAIYYYRAYAANSIGTTLDSVDTSFYTLAATPTSPTVAGAGLNTLNVTIGTGDGNPSATTYAIYETTSGKYVQHADGALGSTADYQTAATWGTKTVTGLTVGHAYVFEVFAQNGAGTVTAAGPPTSGTTLNVSFTAGNLVVELVGNGSTLSSASTPVAVQEFTTAGGSPVQTFSMPNVSPRPGANPFNLTASGTATSEGLITRSADGRILCIPGYNGINGDASIASSSASTIARVIGVLAASNGTPDTSRGLAIYSANNMRCVGSVDGSGFWMGGPDGTAPAGIVYYNGTVTTLNAGYNARYVKAINGNLYFSCSSGSKPAIGVHQLGSGLPTSGTPTYSAVLTNASMTSPYGFDINPAGNIAYVADDGAGIFRFDKSGGTWSLTYTLNAINARGLAVDWSGSSPVVYITDAVSTTTNHIYKITDNGAGSPSTTLATANANYVFRGIAFAPTNSAPSVLASAATSVTNTSATLNGNVASDGGATVIERGFCYKTNSGVTLSDNKTTVAGTTGSYSSSPSLSANTHYYFVAYASNSVGATLSSPELDFWTLANLPTMPTTTNVTASSADLTLGADGNPGTTTNAIHDSAHNLYVQADGTLGATAVYRTAADWGTKTVTGLAAGTLYTFEVKASNGAGTDTGYGTSVNVLTVPAAPAAQAADAANSSGFTARWLAATGATNYFLDVAPDAGFSSFVGSYNNLAVGNVTNFPVSGLSVSSTYYYQVRAQDAAGISSNSAGILASTTPMQSVPTLGSPTVTGLGDTLATLGATVTGDGNAGIAERGTVWDTTPTPTAHALAEGGTMTGAYVQVRSGLPAGTLVYYRGYASNSQGVGYSGQGSFYTLSAEPSSPAGGFKATAIASNVIALSWTAADGANGYLVLMKQGTNPIGAPTDATGYNVNDTIGDGTVKALATGTSATVTGLAAGTPYNFTIFPYAWDGTTNATLNYLTSPLKSANATTLATLPAVTTSNTWVTGVTNAAGGGTVTDNGGDAGVLRGVCFSTASGPDIAGAHTADGDGTGSFASVLNGLVPNTTYYVRAYATNSVGIAYGNETNFTTFGLGAPTNLRTVSTNIGGFTAAWDPVAGAQNYRLDVAASSVFGVVTTSPGTNAYHSGVTNGVGVPSGWVETNTTGSGTGTPYMRMQYVTSAMITPPMDFTGQSAQTLRFQARTYSTTVPAQSLITLAISTDNGTTWTPFATRQPATNALNAVAPVDLSGYCGTQVRVKLATLGATGSAGAGVAQLLITNVTTTIVPSYVAGYSNATVGPTSAAVTGLSANATYYYRVRATCPSSTSPNSITQTVSTAAADADSFVQAPTVQVASGDISSLATNALAPVPVFNFKVTDRGTADGWPTKVTQVTIRPGPNNTANWSNTIQTVALSNLDSGASIGIGAPTITDGSIVIPVAADALNVADGASVNVQLSITLKPGTLTDNSVLQFRIPTANPGFVASGAGSGFTADFASQGAGEVDSNSQTVRVVATRLVFTSVPTWVSANSNFAVTVTAQDAAGNTDVDRSESVALSLASGGGALTYGGPQALVAGASTWPTLQLDTASTYTILAGDGSLTAGISGKVRVGFQPFLAGNLAILSADNAATTNTTCTIIELDPSVASQSTPVSSTPIVGTGTTALRFSGSASSVGYLARSGDGSLLAFTGANTNDTTVNVNAALQRGVGTFDVNRHPALQTTYKGISNNQTRCATSLDNANWVVGDQNGIYTNGATTTSPSGNFRGVKCFGGQIYAFAASTSTQPVFTVSGSSVTPLPGLPLGNTSMQDFYMIASGSNGATNDVLYILQATSASTGTIYKYSMVGGSWTSNGSNMTTFGGFGLAVATNGDGTVALYITSGTGATSPNTVQKVTDAAAYNQSISLGTATTLYTAAAGTTLKGIDFVPSAIAEPATQASSVALAAGAIGAMTVNWTSGDGAGRLVVCRAWGAPSDTPMDGALYAADANFNGSGSALGGGKVVYVGSGNSVTVTGLSDSTTYYVQVYEYNGSGATINYLTTVASCNPSRFTRARGSVYTFH